MQNTKPIGLFDSGIGGTSIWNEINNLLPFENTIYLADSKNAPYGKRSKEEIIELCNKNMDLLISKNCKQVVVACNTATTNAIAEIRHKYNIPIIGIEPAIKPATSLTKTNNIGVLATKGTITSELFSNNVKKYTNITFQEQIGYGLVELIEEGKINSPEIEELLKKYLTPMVKNGIDTLVLGCTHYPYLIPKIKKIIPDNIIIIDSGMAVAKQTKRILEQENLLNESSDSGSSLFYTNSNVETLKMFTKENSIVEYLDF